MDNVDRVQVPPPQYKTRGNDNNNSKGSVSNNGNQRECKFCLQRHKWGKKFCYAAGKNCDACKKLDHFEGSSVCQGEVVAEDTVSVSDPLQALFLGSVTVSEDQSFVEDEYLELVEMPDEEVFQVVEELTAVVSAIDATSISTDDVPNSLDESVLVSEEFRSLSEDGTKGTFNPVKNLIDPENSQDRLVPEEVFIGSAESESPEPRIIKRSRQEIRAIRRTNEKYFRQVIKAMYKEDKIANVEQVDKNFYITVKTGDGHVRFKIDTGADVSVIGTKYLHQFGLSLTDLKTTNKTLKAASGTPLKCHGFFVRKLKCNT